MRKRILYCYYGLLIIGGPMIAQQGRAKKAASDFENYAFTDAIDSYSKLHERGYTDADIYANLGDANYYNAKYAEAADWYGKLMDLLGKDADPEYIYRYAQTLKSKGIYDESDKWMHKFSKERRNDSRAERFAASKDYLETIRKNSDKFIIKNMSLNSAESDFAPSFYGEDLVFSTSRDSGFVSRNIHVWNKRPFANLYVAQGVDGEGFKSVTKLSRKLNTKAHESSTAFSNDGQTIYFTRNNSRGRSFSRDSQGVSRLKIYRATFKRGNWTDVTELPFNSDEYSVAHPTLSPDGKKLYFASDMPGTKGLSDIWEVDIHDDGTFGEPKNLGPGVNTEARETFPFITDDNLLYFASDGHPGLGGLDVFATQVLYRPDARAINAGEPINSKEDDFSFIIKTATNGGYFASNRDGGRGQDDIYEFKQIEPLDFSCERLVTFKVMDNKTKNTLSEVNVKLANSDRKQLANGSSAADGRLEFNVDCAQADFALIGQKEGYDTSEMVINTSDSDENVHVLLMNPSEEAIDFSTTKIEPVYFDFDRYGIRMDAQLSIKKVLEYMIKYPELKVQIGSHTDSRASRSYNQQLSEKRALATKEYLVSEGIASDRITAKGYGENQLTNECDDNTECPEERHQKNRRSEFTLKD